MAIETITLVENITTEATDSSFVYSTKSPGPGYHKNGDGVGTVFYSTNDFIRTLKLQGTLAQYPGEDDWVDIENTALGLGEDSTVFQEDKNPSFTTNITFTGKFVWVRAAYNLQNGTLNTIRDNY